MVEEEKQVDFRTKEGQSRSQFFLISLVKMAFQYKEEGNAFFKVKEFKKALSKYMRVFLFTRALLPETRPAGAGLDGQASSMLKMAQQSKVLFIYFRI
jgi:hypothetical protein